ncbi:hypothetical protein M409DRAFT_59728 [Zasmidium cellare ATCC 36951]|uniref:Uncharacterized protein n=1 Tax=Zasmidium cellare ATCC 36951 TaxID=1080233 RepID=A0A6A6C5N3_ZASCE|nr:uncharacterized protein M409DRAFT_59728 [Zasmidium cellare ATCC 36951]KAF2160696.1 hypothetical protein M409DRAFT_59728 [Zasmidium cellare ATCC 36951]
MGCGGSKPSPYYHYPDTPYYHAKPTYGRPPPRKSRHAHGYRSGYYTSSGAGFFGGGGGCGGGGGGGASGCGGGGGGGGGATSDRSGQDALCRVGAIGLERLSRGRVEVL